MTLLADILTLPVPYIAYVQGQPVGAICCRKEAWDRDRKTGRRAYIMTLGVLPDYRRLGIGNLLYKMPVLYSQLFRLLDTLVGSLLLERILSNLSSSPAHQDLDWVCLHVQSANIAAHSFYESHGFRVLEWVEGYYERNLGVVPPDAFLLGLNLQRSRQV